MRFICKITIGHWGNLRFACMKKLQLDGMSVDDLWALHEELLQILSARILKEKQQLEDRLEQLSQAHPSASVYELRSRRSGTIGRRFYPKVHPKYQNPQRPEETWSGRGKQPRWLVEALSSGMKIEDFKIAGDTSKNPDWTCAEA